MGLTPAEMVQPRAALGFGAMAVSPNELASQAAIEVMSSGGSAADGAVAANAVLGVVLPTASGLGGDVFAIVHEPGGEEPMVLNASGRAGSGVLRGVEELRAAGELAFPVRGPLPITVPGCLDGWLALQETAGRLPLATVLAPAIRHAEDGYPASAELVGVLTANQAILQSQPPAPYLYPNGAPPTVGARIRRPDLARTMHEIASGGRDALYAGRIGQGIITATDGRITAKDLARPSAEWVRPIRADVFGQTAWTAPPNSQGYVALAALWLAEQLDPPTDPYDPRYHHLLVEAYRAVAWERDDLLTDADHMTIHPDQLCDPDRLRPRLTRISDDAMASWPDDRDIDGGTVFIAAVDADGMGVSLISSLFAGIGSGIAAGDSGVFLQNRGAGFSLVPGHRNEAAPGKRTMHTLSPTLWTKSGRLAMLLGTRGGHTQPQILLQVAAHMHHAGIKPSEAQAFPRWTLDGFQPGRKPTLSVENRMPMSVVDGLLSRGHDLRRTEPFVEQAGPVGIITIDQNKLRTGAADPRVSDAAPALR